ncbi:MAG: hypothetical protein GY742_03585 [Hyphomicrobiales bacterium]|nr:hypothetical protein [Hyphomicrobiales bacterium]
MIRRLVYLFLLFLISTTPVIAHSPYYTQTESIGGLNNQIVVMKLLHGDGIFFADPIRAVIVDEDGMLLAASPMSTTLFLSCKGGEVSRECVAYDELRGLIYQPTKSLWKTTELLEKNGKPETYPEYRMEEYGFTKYEASFTDVMKYEAQSIMASPISTAILVVWWTVIWSLVTPLFWRFKGSGWRIRNASAFAALLIVLRLVCVAALVLATAYGWLLDPYSLYFFIFVVLFGATVALMLTKPKESRKLS